MNDSAAHSHVRQPAAPRASLIVALADDDPVWRFLTGSALREQGWEIADFDSGESLLEGLALARPDVVILDAVMPGIDGFETCRRLRAGLGKDLAVLMLTSLEDEKSIRCAYEAGANDFFIKSTHWSLLAERIRHLASVADTARRLRRSDARLAQIHGSARAGSFEFDPRTHTISGSRGSFCVLGFDHSTVRLSVERFERMLDPADMKALRDGVRQSHRERGEFSCVVQLLRPDGEKRRLMIHVQPEIDGDGRVGALRFVACDLTEDPDTRAQARHLSRHDALTGLPNRNAFLAELGAAIGRAAEAEQRVAVVLLDLDRFTQINETLGQVAGDDLLCQVSARLVDSLAGSPADSGGGAPEGARPVVARLPGDEFALMFPVVRSVAEVGEQIECLQRRLQQPFEIAGAECFVSASVGVALYPRDADSAGILLTRADRAVREVKSRGRNDVAWYRASAREDGRNRFDMIAGLHRALERNEFELHYQPWIDLATGRVTGLEALLRWRRGDRQVPPGEFIPLAEDAGLIVPIGEWVLQHAATQLASWRRSGLPIGRVAVNVPTVHFERESLLTTLRAATHINALPPQSIELELTETCMVRDFEETLPRLEALIDAGATLAMDDFGTGYSSLAYLTRLPMSKLKVDRAFVSQLGVSEQGGAVCRAIVALGQSLGVQVLAEGVETDAQVRALLEIGCRLMQGFLFARPVPAAEVAQAITRAEAHATAYSGRGAAGGAACRESVNLQCNGATR